MRRVHGIALTFGVLAALALLGLLVASAGPRDPRVSNALERVASLPYVTWSRVAEADRDKSGVILHDPRAWPGLNVYCAEGRPGGAVLDMKGKTVLTVPDRRKKPEDCRMLEPDGIGGFVMLTVEGTLLRTDVRGRVVVERNLDFHHDAIVSRDGRIWALTKQTAHHPAISRFKRIDDNLLVALDPDGTLELEISFAEMTARSSELLTMAHNRRGRMATQLVDNVFNANTVELIEEDVVRDGEVLFGAGQVLVCWRNLDLVGVLDVETQTFVWTWGPGELERPHHPSLLPNGNLLIFDNGKYRGWSRVLEVDPASNEIVWEYRADPVESFFSESRGAAQRLPNGNTLITESTRGRVFEVTADGETVWEYFEEEVRSGFFGGPKRSTIYRMMRATREELTPGAAPDEPLASE